MEPIGDAPQAGTLRAVYFLALAIASLFVVITALSAFYDGPEGTGFNFPPGSGTFGDGGSEFQEAQRKEDEYQRNVSAVLGAVSAAMFAIPIFGLGARFNPLRAGVTLSALLTFLIAMGFSSSSSDQWVGFIMATIVLAVLVAGITSLEDGLPMGPRQPVRRLEPSEIAPPPQPAPSPPPSPPPDIAI